jgi:hypothetical protein
MKAEIKEIRNVWAESGRQNCFGHNLTFELWGVILGCALQAISLSLISP